MTTPRPQFSAPMSAAGTPDRRRASVPSTDTPLDDDTEKGTVRWFDADKGYGFIRRDRTGDDVFVHHAEIVSDGYRALSAAQRVRFHVHSGSKGLRSTRVEPL